MPKPKPPMDPARREAHRIALNPPKFDPRSDPTWEEMTAMAYGEMFHPSPKTPRAKGPSPHAKR
jgi:hypothetical protein